MSSVSRAGPSLLLASFALVAYLLAGWLNPPPGPMGASSAAPIVAAGGFGRPVQLGSIDASGDAQVALASGGEGVYVVWEQPDGVRLQPLPGIGAASSVSMLVPSNAIRALWAGSAGGEPVVAWLERDFLDGRYRVLWTWRDETREAFRSSTVPEARIVRGGDEPEIVSAVATAEGWRIRHHTWSGDVAASAPRDPRWSVRGLDAARVDEALQVAWLEGSNEVVLGRVQATWTAYLAAWGDANRPLVEARALGPGLHRGAWDVVRLAGRSDGVHVAWPNPDGRLRVQAPDGSDVDLGRGTLLGSAGGAWLWIEDAHVWRRTAEGTFERVLLLPAVPERVALTTLGDVTAVAWSSGRYLGGLEVWGVHDAEPYEPTWVDRTAFAMGWDPWNPWSAVAGHTLTALLVAILVATGALPVWWIGAGLQARFGAADGVAVRRDGIVLGLATFVLLLAALRALGGTPFAVPASVVGSAAVHGSAVVIALGVTLVTLVNRDLEATSGRLLAAGLAGTVALTVWTFATLNAWQSLIVAST